jgi:hypothetical protein
MDLREVVKAAKDQGWTLQPTRHGFFFVPPDTTKAKVLVHNNPPENSLKAAVKLMKQQGFIWPPAPKKKG